MNRRGLEDLRAKLFLALLRSRSLEEALRSLADEDVEISKQLRSQKLKPVLLRVAKSAPEDFGPGLKELSKLASSPWVELAAYAKLAALGDETPLERLQDLARIASGKIPPDSIFSITINVLQACACRNGGDRESAGFYLREAENKVQACTNSMLRTLSTPQVLTLKSSLSRADGDFASAFRSLEEAVTIARRHGLKAQATATAELISLLWSTGQFERALSLGRDPMHRSMIFELGPARLLSCHLSAAKCAIDLGDKEVATSELRAAEQLLRESSDLPKMLRGYTILYLGELEILHGRLDPAVAKFNEACDWFEAMDPPFHSGLLDAKIAMAHHAISKREHRRLFPIIHKLLEEADEKGCLEARARLLVLESALFVSENPPLRAAFEDLVTRMHLIQNPALMLQALANLYVHSLRYLDQPDQAFLMARLRRLQKVLEESHYQDLYEQHIEKRYSWAIENRLAEFLEAEESLLEEEEPEKG